MGEFDHADPTQRALRDILGRTGRMIGGSKSGYAKLHPEHVPVFNAGIFLDDGAEIWYGDLDLTLDTPRLRAIADLLGEQIYILYEGERRALSNGRGMHRVADLAIAMYAPGRGAVVGNIYVGGYWVDRDGAPRRRITE